MTVQTQRLVRIIASYLDTLRAMRNDIRTRRFLSTLPSQLQRDIGWPEPHDR